VAAGLIRTALPTQRNYPDRPVRFIVPYGPGGGSDTTSRIIAKPLAEMLGQQIVIDNRPGAGTIIGAELAAKSPPDGYTIFSGITGTMAINPSIYAKLPYDPIKDFAPITQLVDTAMALIVTPALPVKSVADLIALAKTKPLNYGSTGNGSISHLTMEAFKHATGINVSHVPYKGAAPAMIDMLAGQVSLMFTSTASAAPYVASGKLRMLAVAWKKRSALMPDVPTLIESGVKDFESTVWVGMAATGGTPQLVIRKLHDELVRALQAPDMQSRLAPLGAEPVGSTPEQFAALIREDIARWARVVKASGIGLD
jgi:tripartite-type tricarboxylate transporter receptor subunit TctC